MKNDTVADSFAIARTHLEALNFWTQVVQLERLQLKTIIVNLLIELGKNELKLSETDVQFALDYDLIVTGTEDQKNILVKIVLESDD
jgi:hypothetical protein